MHFLLLYYFWSRGFICNLNGSHQHNFYEFQYDSVQNWIFLAIQNNHNPILKIYFNVFVIQMWLVAEVVSSHCYDMTKIINNKMGLLLHFLNGMWHHFNSALVKLMSERKKNLGIFPICQNRIFFHGKIWILKYRYKFTIKVKLNVHWIYIIICFFINKQFKKSHGIFSHITKWEKLPWKN